MNLAISRMRKIFKKFNIKAFTLEDVAKILKRERINLVSYPMDDKIKGYYQSDLKRVYRKKFIVLNEKLSKSEILEVLLHELVHHFLHVSLNVSKQTFFCSLANLNDSKQDLEAEAIGLILEIPQAKLLELMENNFDDITEFSADKLKRRLWVYQTHDE